MAFDSPSIYSILILTDSGLMSAIEESFHYVYRLIVHLHFTYEGSRSDFRSDL